MFLCAPVHYLKHCKPHQWYGFCEYSLHTICQLKFRYCRQHKITCCTQNQAKYIYHYLFTWYHVADSVIKQESSRNIRVGKDDVIIPATVIHTTQHFVNYFATFAQAQTSYELIKRPQKIQSKNVTSLNSTYSFQSHSLYITPPDIVFSLNMHAANLLTLQCGRHLNTICSVIQQYLRIFKLHSKTLKTACIFLSSAYFLCHETWYGSFLCTVDNMHAI